jgi:hypothetical protein
MMRAHSGGWDAASEHCSLISDRWPLHSALSPLNPILTETRLCNRFRMTLRKNTGRGVGTAGDGPGRFLKLLTKGKRAQGTRSETDYRLLISDY